MHHIPIHHSNKSVGFLNVLSKEYQTESFNHNTYAVSIYIAHEKDKKPQSW